MSNGKNPLVLMMALGVPGAAHALGLGDIHVNSALNERLAAEIDIVGATAAELADLRAAVADRETFVHYGADRPGFLSSATFKVTADNQGRPVLAVRSTESFTEPAVSLLVDVRWGSGELVRQYTLLLDPVGFAAPLAAHSVPAASPADQTTAQLNSPGTLRAARKTTHVKVGAKATLRGIAWRVGERSESDLQRMMLAIFRANPAAFDGNINRMHRGALLTIPSFADLAVISKAEAKREIRSQMAAWRTPAMPAPQTPARDTPAAVVPAAALPAAAETAPEAEALDQRIQSLEHELSEMKGLLQSEHDQMIALQQKAARAEQPMPVDDAPQTIESPTAVDAAQSQPTGGYAIFAAIVAGLGILAAALGAGYFRFRRRATALRAAAIRNSLEIHDAIAASSIAADAAANAAAAAAAADSLAETLPGGTPYPAQNMSPGPAPESPPESTAHIDSDATQPALAALADIKPAGRSEAAGGSSLRTGQDTTVNLRVDTVNLRVDPTRLDYNFLDLDMTAQHVQMPSVLNENAVVKERRTNLADVLKVAIEREPDRQDLRMKLLELYYSAAATNRQAFLEVVQKFARDRDYLPADQWDKIAFMGRQIAGENPLFAAEATAEDDLADCA